MSELCLSTSLATRAALTAHSRSRTSRQTGRPNCWSGQADPKQPRSWCTVGRASVPIGRLLYSRGAAGATFRTLVATALRPTAPCSKQFAIRLHQRCSRPKDPPRARHPTHPKNRVPGLQVRLRTAHRKGVSEQQVHPLAVSSRGVNLPPPEFQMDIA